MANVIKVLLVSDDQETFKFFANFTSNSILINRSISKESALIDFSKNRYDYIFIDLVALKNFDGKKKSSNEYKMYLAPLWEIFSCAKIVILASPTDTRECVYAVKAGADNYISYPLNEEEITYIIELERKKDLKEQEINYLSDQLIFGDQNIVTSTKSKKMQETLQKIRAVAETKTTVLLVGETGTGKSMFARFIHSISRRREEIFVGVHCGAIPDTLVESELFGHEKGSFTGAIKRKLGKFEMANKGCIFLDEIGTVSSQTQIKLLQVLQERSFQRVGGDTDIKVDVRIIAASNIDLKQLSKEGSFREDLFYRVNVFPIEIPALRDRLEDIELLSENVLKKLNQTYLKNIKGIDGDVISAFKQYSWPGNVRELENLIERAFILETSPLLRLESFPQEIIENINIAQIPILLSNDGDSIGLSEARKAAIDLFERNYLTELLSRNKGKVKMSADMAQISTRQLHKLLKRYDISRLHFKEESNRLHQ